ncbi:hypothetical protein [Streptomyces sp. NRRL F-5135]|uniref:hypothetical protein n=1 Tax=Streptomyces sp. NRRL F-5135 TaxID=1463858 RepID=UPI00068A639B|nr:hypothetical protein [Streptomyces sp. NRRL F-5135]
MATPDELEERFTLLTAVARHDELRTREALTAPDEDGLRLDQDVSALTREETLELLALSELIARKAAYGRQLSVRSARAAGASWARIGAALGTSKQAAWEAHTRWIEEQRRQHLRTGSIGWDETDEAAARALAGDPDDTSARHEDRPGS